MIMLLTKVKGAEKVDRTFFALGTINNIKIFNTRNEDAEDAMDEAIERINEIDDQMSAFKPESDISKISRNAGNGLQKVQKDTFELVRRAAAFGALSGGAFDITIRPLVELWGINKKGDFIPSNFEIQKALSLVNYQDIKLDEKSQSVSLKKSEQSLDLGGIAKGFAADEVKRILIKNGIHSAVINLGGNIITIGKRPDGQPWQIGIQNPFASRGVYLGVVSASNKTIVTSGSNEQFFIKDGVRYHHILDPHTGKPAQSSLLSVTVICSNSTDADALTTALFILGPEKSMPLLNERKADAIFVTEDLSVFATSGLKNKFILL